MIYTRQLIYKLSSPKPLFNYTSNKREYWNRVTYLKCFNIHHYLKCPVDKVDKIDVIRMDGVNLFEFYVNNECIYTKALDRKIPLVEQVTRTLFI
jgi:hypothetical protein